MSGFSDIGAALAGIGQDPTMNPNYQTGMLRGAQASDILEQARNRRNQNLALAALTPDVVQRAQAGDPQAQAQLVAYSTQADRNPQQLTGAQQDQQTMGFRESLMARALGANPDVNGLNLGLGVLSGKPMTLSAVQGGTLIDPTATPGDQAALGGNVATAVGQSDITKALAAAGASNAAAGEHGAQAQRALAGIGADKAGNYTVQPDADGNLIRINKLNPADAQAITTVDGNGVKVPIKAGGAGTKGAGTVAPTTLSEAFGGVTVGGKPNPAMQDFLAYEGAHPDMSERQALTTYMRAAGNPNKPTGNFDTQPVSTAQPGSDIGAVLQQTPVKPGVSAQIKAAVTPAGNAIPGTTAPDAAPTAGPIRPTSQAQFNALPKGAQFINPSDGRLMVKK